MNTVIAYEKVFLGSPHMSAIGHNKLQSPRRCRIVTVSWQHIHMMQLSFIWAWQQTLQLWEVFSHVHGPQAYQVGGGSTLATFKPSCPKGTSHSYNLWFHIPAFRVLTEMNNLTSFSSPPEHGIIFPILRSFKILILLHRVLIVVCGTLIPQPGIETRPPALGAWNLSHWTTREVSPYI